jgi:hypothetical protein
MPLRSVIADTGIPAKPQRCRSHHVATALPDYRDGSAASRPHRAPTEVSPRLRPDSSATPPWVLSRWIVVTPVSQPDPRCEVVSSLSRRISLGVAPAVRPMLFAVTALPSAAPRARARRAPAWRQARRERRRLPMKASCAALRAESSLVHPRARTPKRANGWHPAANGVDANGGNTYRKRTSPWPHAAAEPRA